jgi:hypothetical protein
MRAQVYVPAAYALLVVAALVLLLRFPPPGDFAYLSAFGLFAIFVLTLPWCLILLPFMWALMHEPQAPLFVAWFVISAIINTFLIWKFVQVLREAKRPASS